MRGPQWRRRWALLPQVRGGGGGLGCRARAALGCLQQLMCSLPLNPPLDGAHLTFVCFLPPYSLQPPPWCPRCLPSLPPWPMARCRWAWGAGGWCVLAALSLRNALCPARFRTSYPFHLPHLTHAPASPSPSQVATSAVQTLAAAGEAVQASDLDPLLDLAGAAGPALAQTGSSARRRLLQAATSPAQLAAALDALTRSFAVADGAQSALLASMVGGKGCRLSCVW